MTFIRILKLRIDYIYEQCKEGFGFTKIQYSSFCSTVVVLYDEDFKTFEHTCFFICKKVV